MIDLPRFSGAEVTPLTIQIHQGCGSPAFRPVGTRAEDYYKSLQYYTFAPVDNKDDSV